MLSLVPLYVAVPWHTAGVDKRSYTPSNALLLVAQGCEATVCMPTTTPDIKVDAVRRLGGAVELVGESYQETQAYAQVGRFAMARLVLFCKYVCLFCLCWQDIIEVLCVGETASLQTSISHHEHHPIRDAQYLMGGCLWHPTTTPL